MSKIYTAWIGVCVQVRVPISKKWDRMIEWNNRYAVKLNQQVKKQNKTSTPTKRQCDSVHGHTFIHGPGDGSTQSHVACVCGPFVGDLTLFAVRLRPEGEVHGVDHKHPIQSLWRDVDPEMRNLTWGREIIIVPHTLGQDCVICNCHLKSINNIWKMHFEIVL